MGCQNDVHGLSNRLALIRPTIRASSPVLHLPFIVVRGREARHDDRCRRWSRNRRSGAAIIGPFDAELTRTAIDCDSLCYFVLVLVLIFIFILLAAFLEDAPEIETLLLLSFATATREKREQQS